MRIRLRGFWASRFGLALLGSFLFLFLLGAGFFTYYWLHFARLIDENLSGPVFAKSSRIFTAPRRISTGEPLTAQELAAYLQRAGYTEADVPAALGRYQVEGRSVIIRPAAQSYFGTGDPLRVDFAGREVSRIVHLTSKEESASAELEPELLTNLFDESREKRRVMRFDDLPRVLVNAVLAAEDARFMDHAGIDFIRVAGAAWHNLRRSDRREGASTISMQVARSYLATPENPWHRKAAETMMALQLEQRFTKQQIFELYANQIYLGNRGSFAIRGYGEAAQAYFGKDVRDVTLAEAAFLAGIARSPNRYSYAERHLERANEARNRVLAQMVEQQFITPEAADAAKRAPWRFVRGAMETSAAPYFVDMVKEHVTEKIPESELLSQSYRIYTTLDPALQRAAAAAMEIGLAQVDKQLERRYAAWRAKAAKTGEPVPVVQAALVALDPRTGEIRALIGGRDYGQSQLNRALARRQPGSVFKPFVYAAAFDTPIEGVEPVLTPLSVVDDEPTVFQFGGKEYAPNNYGERFMGRVTLRTALTHSLNNATVRVAEEVGYGRVVDIAQAAGITAPLLPTPAIALGAYEMTPVEVAAAYTVFANRGVRAEPVFLRSVVDAAGAIAERNAPRVKQAIDPRVAYLVTNVLEDVINRGTAATVRARGFAGPAAGKTGTSHDGWFAGFTSNLVCVVWVGFDDNRELGLAGSASAAPIWAEFMKRATTLPAYRNLEEFTPPEGIVEEWLDADTHRPLPPDNPRARREVFIAGTETGGQYSPEGAAGAPAGSWLSRVFGGKKTAGDPAPPVLADGSAASAHGEAAVATPPSTPAGPDHDANGAANPAKASPNRARSQPTKAPAKNDQSSQPNAAPPEQKGFFRRLFGIFGGKKDDAQKSPPAKDSGQPQAKPPAKSPS